MDLTTFRSRIMGAIGLSSSSEQTLVDGWVNEGYEQVLLQTGVTVCKTTLPLTAGEGDYRLPDEILRMKTLYVEDEPENTLIPVSVDEVLQMRASEGLTEVRWYALDGHDLLMLYGTPAESGNLIAHYVKRPTALTTGADIPTDVPTEFHRVIEAYAKAKAADWDDDTSSQVGMKYEAEYQAGLKDIKVALNKARGRHLPRLRPKRSTLGRFRSNGVDYGV